MMNIEELRHERIELENKIMEYLLDAFADFKKRTGIGVQSIDVFLLKVIRKRQGIHVKLKLEDV